MGKKYQNIYDLLQGKANLSHLFKNINREHPRYLRQKCVKKNCEVEDYHLEIFAQYVQRSLNFHTVLVNFHQ